MKINDSTSPVDIIETTQKLRLRMVNKITNEGENVPSDPKEVSNLSMLLRDLDAAALTTRKLDVEEKGVDAATVAAANVVQVLKEMGHNPFKVKPNEDYRIVGEGPKIDVSLLPEVKLVPGVTKIGTDTLEYAEFVIDDNPK